jgi:hypothetical protein
MNSRTILIACLILCGLVSCSQKPNVVSDIADDKSQLLTVIMQTADFEPDMIWDKEQVQQNYEIPSAANHWLNESAARGLVGTINGNQLIIITHILNRYDRNVNWTEDVKIEVEDDYSPISIVLPSFGDRLNYQCYSNSLLLTCQIIVQYKTVISKLSFETSQNLIENNRIKLIESVLSNIDARISKVE